MCTLICFCFQTTGKAYVISEKNVQTAYYISELQGLKTTIVPFKPQIRISFTQHYYYSRWQKMDIFTDN